MLATNSLAAWIAGNYKGEVDLIEESLRIGPNIGLLGNVLFLLALALVVFIFWPLPLLHGRKPYIMISLLLMIPLQIPQGLTLPPYTIAKQNESMVSYVLCFYFFRAISGGVLGFTVINCLSTVLDLFSVDTGACCRGGVVLNGRAIKKQNWNLLGGGIRGSRPGMWIAMFVWSTTVFYGIGFFVGQLTINSTTPAWGFWITAIITGSLLIIVGVVSEVRPPWKRHDPAHGLSRHISTNTSMPTVTERGEISVALTGISPN